MGARPDVEVSVTKIALAVAINNATSVYRATLDTLTSSLTTGSLAGGQDAGKTYDVVLNLTLSTTATTTSNVNTYPISGNYTNGNYDVTFTGSYTGGTQGTYTITKVAPVITTTGVNKTYTYNGLEQSVSSGATTDQVGDYISPIVYSNNKFTNVGTGTQVVTISTAENQNYNAATTTVTITISKIALTVSIADKTSVYKESIVELTSTLTTGTLAGGQDAGKTYDVVLNLTLSTTATKTSNVGAYPISGSYNNGNYDVMFSGSYSGNTQGTYTIGKADSVVSGTLGSYTYTGSQQTITGLTLNHTETTIQYSNNTFTNVPAGGIQQVTYYIAPTTNYNGIGNTTVDVTINKANSVISGSLGTYTYNGSEQTITGLMLSEGDGTIVYTNNKFTDVPTTGIQKVKYSVAATNNYNGIAETEVDVTISKLAITVTIADKSSVYGTTLETLTSSVTSGAIAGGQDAGKTHDVVLSLSLSTAASSDSNAGAYAISGSYNNGNYDVTFAGSYTGGTQGTYTITKADSVISGSLGTYTFSGVEQTIIGLTLSEGDGTIVYTNNKFTDVPTTGTQKVKYSVAPTTNYNGIAETEVDVTINKASTVIVTTGVNKTYTYNGLEQTVNSGATTEQVGTAGVAVAVIKYSNNTFTNVGTGSQTVTIYTDATQNYLAGSTTAEITILPIALTVTIDDKGSAYGTDIVALSSSVTSGSLAGGQDADKTHDVVLNLTLSTTATKTSNVGTYPISGSYNNGNYAVTFSGSYSGNTQGTYTIGKASVTATISDASKTYGESDPAFDFVVNSGLVNGDEKADLGITLERINTSNAVGEYTITKASQTNNNYEVTMTSGKLTINVKAIEVKVEDKTSVYGSSVADLSWVLNTGSSMAYEEVASEVLVINLSCAASSSSNAGTYAISGAADATSSKNYSISFVGTYASDNTKGTYEITPATVDVTISNASKTYGQDDPSFGFTVTSGLVNPDTASSLGLTLVRANSTVQTVGTYAITKDSHTNNNYLVNVTQNGVFTINTKAIEVKVEDKTSVYGQALSSLSWVLNTGSSMAYEEVASEVLVIDLACAVTTSSPRGTYPITGTVGIGSSDNYNISFVGSYTGGTKGTYTVTKALRTISYTGPSSLTYNGSSQSFTGVSLSHPDDNDDLTYTGNSFTDVPASGKLTFTISAEASTNYEACSLEVEVSVNKLAITVTIADKSSVYGTTLETLTSSVTSGALAGGQDAGKTHDEVLGITLSTMASKASNVGTYPISGGYTSGNYDVTFSGSYSGNTQGTYTISQRGVTVKANSDSRVYWSMKQEDETYSATITYANGFDPLTAGEGIVAVNVVLERENGEDVNTYSILASADMAVNNPNYDITFTASTYEITKFNISITPKAGQSKTYGDADPSTYTYEDLVYPIGTGYATLVGALGRAAGEDVNTYAYTIGSFTASDNPNYNITLVEGKTFTITRRDVIITPDANQGKEYYSCLQADESALTYTHTSLKDVNFVNFTPSALNGALERTSGENAGDYTISEGSLINANNGNYNITVESGVKYVISKFIVTVKADSGKTKRIGTDDPEFTYTVNRTPAALGYTPITGSLTRQPGEAAGTYEILQGNVDNNNNPNYDITFVSKLFTITSKLIRTLEYTGPESLVYNGFSQSFEGAQLSHLDDDNTITYSANNTFINVPEGNTLTFMIYGAESTNYAPCSLEVTVSVTKIALTVTIGDKGSVYGVDIVALTSSVTTGSLAGGQDAGKTHDEVLGITLSTMASKASNVGTYPISGGYTSGNYDVTFSGSYSGNTQGTYTISQRGATVKANSDSRVYWSMKQEDEIYSATITYANGFDPLTAGEGIVAVNVVLERENGEDVNTYSILASADMAANNPNYDITFTAGTYEITKFNISITPKAGQSKIYGDADPATYTYEDLIYPTGTGYATLVGALGRSTGEDVNTYAYTIGSFTALDNPNYNITLVEGKTFAINRKSVTITPTTGLSKQYGNLDPQLTFGNNLGEWKASSDSWAAITGVLSRIPGETVNTYAITQGEVTNANNGNYDITFVDSVVFTITRRDVTITPDDNQGKEYYSCLQADESALTYTHTSLKDVNFVDFTPDVLDGKLARAEGEDAGNYLINLGTLINDNNPNYNLNIDAVNYVISKFKIQVTADSGKEKVYGEKDPVFTYTTDSMPAVEGYKALEGALTRKNLSTQTVGDYQILQGTLTNTKNSNYDITFVSAFFQITKKAVTITPDTLSKQYGNLDPALTYSAPLGEWKADETGNWAAFVGQLSRNNGEIVGEYSILPGTLVEYNNPNYDINFIDTVKFTITRRDVTITPNSNQSKEYYECLQVAESDLTYTYSALKDANFESFTPKALEGTLARAEGEDAGDYLINLGTLTNDKNSNYNISIETQYYVIRPFEVEITPNSGQQKVYGEVDPVFAYTTDRMPVIEGYKALEGKLTRASIDEQNAGNYQILQGNLTNAKNLNYNITFSVSVVTFKINPKSIEIKIADKSSIEGDEPVQLTWTLNDGFSMAYEESAEVELEITLVAIDVTSSSTVGEYEIIGTVEAYSSDNYLITFVGNHIDGDKGIYTIIAAMLLNPVFNLSYFNTHIYTYTGETQTVGSGAILEIGTANQKANITYENNTFTTVSEGNALLVKVSVEADGEYNAYSATFRIKVQKAETQINLSSMKTVFTYNGQLQTASGAKVNHLENANITYENNTFTTVSEGNGKVVKIKAAATANYKAKETTVTLTVNKATYDFSHCTFGNQEKEYNCEEQMIEIEGKLPVGFDGSKPKVEYIGSLKNVGCVEVKVKITSISENYMIPEIDAERCAMLTICKKRITISVKPFLAIENKKYNFEFDIDGLQGTDTMEIFDVKPEVEGYGTSIEVEAGRYTVEPFGASASNYEISYLPYTLIVHKENLTSDLGNNVDLTITGYYDPSFQLEVTPDKDFEFDDPLSKILHIVQKSYKVKVVGGEGLELPESIKLIYRDNTLKSSILNRAYWINENGDKINLSAKDVVKEGFLETKFTGEHGELIIYKDYTVIYIIVSVSILVLLVVLYLIYREYRDKKKRATQRAEAAQEARKANIRKKVRSKEGEQPKVEEDKNKTVEPKDQKDLPKTEESKDSKE